MMKIGPFIFRRSTYSAIKIFNFLNYIIVIKLLKFKGDLLTHIFFIYCETFLSISVFFPVAIQTKNFFL